VKKVNEIHLFLIGVQEQRKGDQASVHKFQSSSQGKIEEVLKGVKKVSNLFV
jgi:hypothetical protein